MGLLKKATRLADTVLQEGLTPLKVSLSEFRLVGLLLDSKGMSQKELAAKLGIRPATLSVSLSNLEKKGTITRESSLKDQRSKTIRLSVSQDLGAVTELVGSLEDRALDGFSIAEKEALAGYLKRIVLNLSAKIGGAA